MGGRSSNLPAGSLARELRGPRQPSERQRMTAVASRTECRPVEASG